QRMAMAIQSALDVLGHPEASVQVHRQLQKNATVRIRFAINDGPHLPVRQLRFEGAPVSRKSYYARKCKASHRGSRSPHFAAKMRTRERRLKKTVSAS